jgi:hypothetical protein
MAMFCVYQTIPEEEIRQQAVSLLEQIPPWFEAHPERDDCVVEFCYGKVLTLSRVDYQKQIEQATEDAIAHKQ